MNGNANDSTWASRINLCEFPPLLPFPFSLPPHSLSLSLSLSLSIYIYLCMCLFVSPFVCLSFPSVRNVLTFNHALMRIRARTWFTFQIRRAGSSRDTSRPPLSCRLIILSFTLYPPRAMQRVQREISLALLTTTHSSGSFFSSLTLLLRSHRCLQVGTGKRGGRHDSLWYGALWNWCNWQNVASNASNGLGGFRVARDETDGRIIPGF